MPNHAPSAAQETFAFVAAQPFAAVDVFEYERVVESSAERCAFRADPSYANAEALTLRIWTTLVDLMSPGAAILISSSTGKDSSLLVFTWVRFMMARLASGQRVPPVIVGMSDTGSEFPEMESRMRAECDALNAWSKEHGYPLSARIVRPIPRDHLLVEVIGRGKALPILKSGGRRDGRGWCMDRVKKGPLQHLLDGMADEFPVFVNAIGTREDESASRRSKMRAHTINLPFGLTAIERPYNDKDDPPDLGAIPIGHWTNEMVALWLGSHEVPWRPESQRELRSIYHRASTLDEVVGECGLRITQEGKLANTCTDLGGSRIGCWHCFITENKSLTNMAAADPRYEWLRRVHRYIYGHYRRNDRRIAQRNSLGFNEETLFPKAFTFHERYWLLMLVLRAEKESGFPLLPPEDIDAIRRAWRREGVWTVDPMEAYGDVDRWRETGKPVFSYEANAVEMHRTLRCLSEGLPVGAYYHLLERDSGGKRYFNALDLSQLVGLAGISSPLTPALMAYVFRDSSAPDEVFVMVTDVPANLGTKLDEKKFNGTHCGHWHCVGVRPAARWERVWGAGRIMFYRFNIPTVRRRTAELMADANDPKLYQALSVFHLNLEMSQGCSADDALAEHWTGINQIIDARGRLTPEEYLAFKEVLIETFLISDDLERHAEEARWKLRKQFRDRLAWLPEDSDRGKAVRSEFEAAARQCYDLDSQVPLIREYLAGFKQLAAWIRSGKVNAAMIERLVYLVQAAAVDPDEAIRLEQLEATILSNPHTGMERLAA